jgi:hypothetical protein
MLRSQSPRQNQSSCLRQCSAPSVHLSTQGLQLSCRPCHHANLFCATGYAKLRPVGVVQTVRSLAGFGAVVTA